MDSRKKIRHQIRGEHEYDNMTLPDSVTPEVIQLTQKFTFQGDVLVASYPKTGTTWLNEMSWLLCNKGDVDRAKQQPTYVRVPYLENTSFTPSGKHTGLDTARTCPRPAVFKTHLPAQFFTDQLAKDDVKILVPMRNYKDTMVSMFHFYRSNKELGCFSGTWNEFYELIKAQKLFYGDIFRWYDSWWQLRGHPKILFVKFEEMKKDLSREIRRIASFIGVDVPEETFERIATYGDFEVMRNNEMVNYTLKPEVFNQKVSPFIRKGEVGDWKNYFTQEQSDYMDKRYTQSGLKQKGLTFDFQ